MQDMGIVSDKVREWALQNLAKVVRAEGELVSEEQAQERLSVCWGCKYHGIVRPVPGIETMGCTLCGCPDETKPHMKSILRKKGAKDAITISEIIELKTTGKFYKSEYTQEPIRCPHPEENKWEDIDEKYNY